MNEKGLKTSAVLVEDNDEILGVNDRVQLEHLTTVLKRKINTYHMRNGVSIKDMVLKIQLLLKLEMVWM